MNVPDVLQYMGVIERPRTIRIVQLASKFIALWFAAAGIVHLVENSGDFFCQYCNGQDIDLFNAVYFMIVTMATVGYGDISCKTYIGKVFVLLCLISGLVSLEQKRSIDSMARLVNCRQRSLQWFQNFRIYSVQRAPTSAGIRGSKANGTSQILRPRNMSLFLFDSHVIIGGHITLHSLASFLKDFLHRGRDQIDELDVLIIDKYVPFSSTSPNCS